MLTRKILFGLAIALLASGSLVAQEAEKTAEKASNEASFDKVAQSFADKMMKSFAKAELTEQQKTQAGDIVGKHMQSYIDARQASDSLLTDEQKAKKKAAMKQAKSDGVKGKKANMAANEAMGLTEDQAASYKASKERVAEISATVKAEITGLLSEEQVALLPKKRKGKKEKKPKGEKKKKKKKKKKKDKETTSVSAQAVSLKLPNMTCGGCAASVKGALAAVDGIGEVETNVRDNTCSFNAPEAMDVAATLNQIVENGNLHIKGWSLVE